MRNWRCGHTRQLRGGWSASKSRTAITRFWRPVWKAIVDRPRSRPQLVYSVRMTRRHDEFIVVIEVLHDRIGLPFAARTTAIEHSPPRWYGEAFERDPVGKYSKSSRYKRGTWHTPTHLLLLGGEENPLSTPPGHDHWAVDILFTHCPRCREHQCSFLLFPQAYFGATTSKSQGREIRIEMGPRRPRAGQTPWAISLAGLASGASAV